jgi:hypothetical protein
MSLMNYLLGVEEEEKNDSRNKTLDEEINLEKQAKIELYTARYKDKVDIWTGHPLDPATNKLLKPSSPYYWFYLPSHIKQKFSKKNRKKVCKVS